MKKPKIHIFDSFEEADDFTKKERLKLSPSERIELCYELSLASWELHKGKLPEASLRDPSEIKFRDLKE
ncbi:MAG: hypothetical protein R3A13_11720 [Bdellovibrionota bacterium]